MGNLIITTVNLGINFFDENSGHSQTFNEFSIKRYTDFDYLTVISDIRRNYAKFKINISDYDSITFDGNVIADLDALETALNNVVLNGGGGGSLIDGKVEFFADLPTPASSYTNQFWLVEKGSGGLFSIINSYKYPKGLYSPNDSNVWEQVPFNVKVSEDSTTLINITNWTEFFNYQTDINAGDRLIYNGLEYVNRSGSITASAPDSDVANWAYPNQTANNIVFDTSNTLDPEEGEINWNSIEGTAQIGLGGGNVKLQLGQEQVINAKNGSGLQINNGDLVYISGASGSNPLINLANANNISTAVAIGWATEDIASNDHGFVTTQGLVRGLNTSGCTEGETLWLSTVSGEFTNIRPTVPDFGVVVGVCLRANPSVGVVFAKIDIVPRLRGLSDVYSPTVPIQGDSLYWNSTNLRWEIGKTSNTINVAKSGGDFTTIKEANDFVATQSPSITNRFTINVHAGIYTESNPINCNPYTTIQGVGSNNTVRVVPSDVNQDLFVANQASFFAGLSIVGVTNASGIAVNTDSLVGCREITIGDCLVGVKSSSPNALVNISEMSFLTIVSPTTDGILIEDGNAIIQTAFVIGQSVITNMLSVDGANTHVVASSLISESSLLDCAVKIDNGGYLSLKATHIDNVVDGILIQGTNSKIQATGIEITNAQNDGLAVANVGTNVSISFNGSSIINSGRYDLNVENVNTTLSGTGELGLSKVNAIEGSRFYASIVDLTDEDEGTNIFGELRQGTPLNPAESTFGGGDSYTRGMLVYTFDGVSTYTDVTTAASSAKDSSFTYPNTNINSSIYCASAIERDGDKLKHLGMKTKVDAAAVLGGGNFVIEYWNGVAWDETHWSVLESESPYYSKAEAIFEDIGGFQVFYDISLDLNVSDWTKNDPMGLGVDLYWIRIRIENAITTSPTIQQIKLHSNNAEIEKDGFINHRGTSRPVKQLPWSIDDTKSWQSSPSNQDLFVLDSSDGSDYDLGVGREENEFTAGNTDKISFGLALPLDLDTSCPIIVEIYYHLSSATAGNIDIKTSKGITGIGEQLGNVVTDAPSTIRDYEITDTIEAIPINSDNSLRYFRATFYVSKAIARKLSDGSSDIVTFAFNRDGVSASDTYSGNLSIYQSRALYYAWALGGHKI